MRRAISMVACLGLAVTTLASTAGSAVSAAHRDPIPWAAGNQYQGRPACHVDSKSPTVRVWWTEQDVPGQLPGSDGSCSTKPHIAELFLAAAPATLRAEKRLGLPKQRTDLWLHDVNPFTGQDLLANGGSKALDIYLGGSVGGGGFTGCIFSGERSGAYLLIGTPGDNGPVSDATYRVVLAHELAHVGQCAIRDGHGHTGMSSSSWVVEGSANMVAAAVEPHGAVVPDVQFGDVPILDYGPVRALSGSPWQLFNADDEILQADDYDTWPFWYSLAKAKFDDRFKGFLKLAARTPDGHKKGDLVALRHEYGAKKLQRALTAAATFDLTGQGLKGLSIPYGFWWHWRKDGEPTQKLDDVGATPRALTFKIPSGALAFVRVRPVNPNGATLSLTVAGTDGTGAGLLPKGVLATDQLGHVVAATSAGHWQVVTGLPPTFTVPAGGGTTTTAQGDSEAWLVFANAGTKSASFKLTATSS